MRRRRKFVRKGPRHNRTKRLSHYGVSRGGGRL